ncbi:hypothetical protein [Streptomyces natalensis]|uniref:hypothetical protein n=1 Tax=Streptomyces natalensis TaxID=68242 RepID=UPI00068B3C6E|nr:hypothetical protein [Streptomyces natalensis]
MSSNFERAPSELDQFAARLLTHQIADSGWHERWNCLPFPNSIQVSDRDDSPSVSMTFRTAEPYLNSTPLWYSMSVSAHEPVEDQVRQFIEQITTTDPREAAQRH